MRPFFVIAICILAAACATPPVQTAPRPAASIAAPLGKTWDAVVDQFGERSIPVRNMERASGFIATQAIALNLRGDDRTAWADCGTAGLGLPLPPSAVEYTVLVRGDSGSSTVRTTARYTLALSSTTPRECVSTGKFENAFEDAVRERVLGHR